jgi:hypothetical protein
MLYLSGSNWRRWSGLDPGARTAVKEDRRLAVRLAAKFPVEAVAVADIEMPGLVGLDGREEHPAAARLKVFQKLISE